MGVEKEGKNDKEKQEIQSLFDKLCSKLDALAHFNYTPKQMKEEIKVVPNVSGMFFFGLFF